MYQPNNWLLRNPDVDYRPYISPPFVLMFRRVNPVLSITTTSFKSILILSSRQRLASLKVSFPKIFSLKVCTHFFISPYVLHVLPLSVVSTYNFYLCYTVVCLVSKENLPVFIFKRLVCYQAEDDNKYSRFQQYVNALLPAHVTRIKEIVYYESWAARQVT